MDIPARRIDRVEQGPTQLERARGGGEVVGSHPFADLSALQGHRVVLTGIGVDDGLSRFSSALRTHSE